MPLADRTAAPLAKRLPRTVNITCNAIRVANRSVNRLLGRGAGPSYAPLLVFSFILLCVVMQMLICTLGDTVCIGNIWWACPVCRRPTSLALTAGNRDSLRPTFKVDGSFSLASQEACEAWLRHLQRTYAALPPQLPAGASKSACNGCAPTSDAPCGAEYPNLEDGVFDWATICLVSIFPASLESS